MLRGTTSPVSPKSIVPPDHSSSDAIHALSATSACRTVSPCSTSCGFYARKTSTKLPGANPSDCDMYYCILCPTYSCLSCPDGNATLTSFSGKCPSCYCAPTATVSAGVHTLEAGSTVDTAVASLLTAPPIAT